MLINRKEIRIEWGDCDPGGIVFFPRYFEYCDACTNALFETRGAAQAGTPQSAQYRRHSACRSACAIYGAFAIRRYGDG